MSEGDDEKREGVLRSGKFYFDRAWNDPPEFKYDAQARAAAATATRGTGGGMKLNKRVGHALKPGALPPPPLGTSPVKMDGDVPAVPNLQDAGARSLADMPPPPPPLSASQKSRPNSHFDVQAASSTATDDAYVDVEACVANLETVVEKNANFTDIKRKDIQKRIGMMAAKWKSGNLNKNVEIGMGRVSQLLMEGDATGADKILQSMMVDYSSHCTPWAVGIKHLIASVKPTGIGETPQKGIENPL